MRGIASVLALMLIGIPSAQAQQPPAQRQPAAAPKPAQKPAAAPTAPSPKDTYAAMTQQERVAIQSDLTWTGDYNGTADGDFNDRSVNAVKTFQARLKAKQTGILNPHERGTLASQAKSKQDAVGWRLIEDAATGSRVGVPTKLASQAGAGKSGSRWSSTQVQVESFRLPSTSLATVLDQQKKEPADRKVDYTVNRPEFFVLSGSQGQKKFYVRAHATGGEVRGISVVYDQAMASSMDPIVVAMSGAFVASSPVAQAAAAAAARRKVEYGTGVVVSAAGHVITDRALTDDCLVITVPGYGNADRLAQDEASGIALIRLYGARDLKPLPLTEAGAQGAVTLIGIADPQAQGGGGAVSTVNAKLAATRVEPTPAAGFAGAAVTDGRGGLVGVVARSGNATQATPADSLRAFLKAQSVETDGSAAAGEDAKTSVVRVICVRK